MYRRPKFLEILDEVRQKMSREADYDMDLFAEMIRQGKKEQTQDESLSAYKLNPQEDLVPEIKS